MINDLSEPVPTNTWDTAITLSNDDINTVWYYFKGNEKSQYRLHLKEIGGTYSIDLGVFPKNFILPRAE